MLLGEMELEPDPGPRRLRGRERLVERRRAVGVEMVLHEHDALGGQKVLIGQRL